MPILWAAADVQRGSGSEESGIGAVPIQDSWERARHFRMRGVLWLEDPSDREVWEARQREHSQKVELEREEIAPWINREWRL